MLSSVFVLLILDLHVPCQDDYYVHLSGGNSIYSRLDPIYGGLLTKMAYSHILQNTVKTLSIGA